VDYELSDVTDAESPTSPIQTVYNGVILGIRVRGTARRGGAMEVGVVNPGFSLSVIYVPIERVHWARLGA